jgi:hypothetical protein
MIARPGFRRLHFINLVRRCSDAFGGTMVNHLRNRALRYRELACDITDEQAREEILRLAAEYEQRAERLLSAAAEGQSSH